MMGFCGEGEITKITTTKTGNVIIAVRDTQVAFNTASGHKMGERDYIWYLVSRTPQEGSHFKNVFFKGARVWFSGKINQKKGTDEENNEYSRNIVFKIDRIDLFNNGDPSKSKTRERYNSKVVGEKTPDIDNNFENDF